MDTEATAAAAFRETIVSLERFLFNGACLINISHQTAMVLQIRSKAADGKLIWFLPQACINL